MDAKAAEKKTTQKHKHDSNIAIAIWAGYNIETIAGVNYSKMSKT